MILLIDNYDSFVFNLAHSLRELGESVVVARNDEISVAEVISGSFQSVVLSPGPGRPEHAGICMSLLSAPELELPVLGVCLGHQAIAAAFGGAIVETSPVHGIASSINHNSSPLFVGIPRPFLAARYHSLSVARPPAGFRVTARVGGEIMAMELIERRIYGVQFHPESILTPHGKQLLANFIRIAQAERSAPLIEAAQSL